MNPPAFTDRRATMNPCIQAETPRPCRPTGAACAAQRGVTLFVALIAMVAMALAAVGLLRSADTATLLSGNLAFNSAARMAGDVGVEAASTALQVRNDASTLNSDAANYYATFDPAQELPPTARLGPTTPNTIDVNGNSVRWVVERMCNAGGQCVKREGVQLFRLSVDATGPAGKGVTVRAVLSALAPFAADDAMITEERLVISGNPTLPGTVTSVHTNGALKISGNGLTPPVGSGTATGVVEECKPTASTCQANQPMKEIPTIIPAQFKAYADYLLLADGRVYNSVGTVLADTSSGTPWNGWKRASTSPVKWVHDIGTAGPNGMYFVEGDVTMSGNPGTAASPWLITLLAVGHIEVSGNPILADHRNAAHPIGVQNLFMVAGTDLKFNGNGSVQIEGIMAANDQVQISGDPTLRGVVIANGASSADGLITENQLNGNAMLIYNGGLATPWGGGSPRRETWRVVER